MFWEGTQSGASGVSGFYVDVIDYLASRVPSGWTLDELVGISDDGRVMVGNANYSYLGVVTRRPFLIIVPYEGETATYVSGVTDLAKYYGPYPRNDEYTVATANDTLSIGVGDLPFSLMENDDYVWGGYVGSYTQPSHGTVSVSPDGSFTYVGDGTMTTTDSFTYKVYRGSLTNSPTATVTIRLP